MIRYKVLQLLFLVSSMTTQMVGMMPQKEVGKSQAEEISSMTPQMKKMGENLGILLPELRHKIISSALQLKFSQDYAVYKKLQVGSLVKVIALNEGNTRALTGSSYGISRLWDVETGRVIKERKRDSSNIQSVALSPDGRIAFIGYFYGIVELWDVLTGELIKTFQLGSNVQSVVLSADGSIVIGAAYKRALLYNTRSGELLKILEGHEGKITSMALNADGKIALTGSTDGMARVWDIPTGKSIMLQVGSAVDLVALNADGTIAVTVINNRKVLVWNAKTGVLLNTLLTKDFVYSVALSKDGRIVLTGTNTGSIQVWNTKPLPGQKETSTPLTVLSGSKGTIFSVAFGGADFIASGSSDKTALIWRPTESVTLK